MRTTLLLILSDRLTQSREDAEVRKEVSRPNEECLDAGPGRKSCIDSLRSLAALRQTF
jgi:hypothetical protein